MYYGDDHAVNYDLVFEESEPVSVILTNVTGASVGGFEFVLTFDDAALVMTSEGLQQGDLNLVPPPSNSGRFLVGLASPRSISTGHATLCEPTFFSFTTEPTYISVTFFENATIPGAIAYNEFDNVGNVHQMFPASESFEPDHPIFAFNNPGFFVGYVETESQTWSDLKNLYR